MPKRGKVKEEKVFGLCFLTFCPQNEWKCFFFAVVCLIYICITLVVLFFLTIGNTFLVVDLQDYRDDTSLTFDGGTLDVSSQTFMRVSTEANVWLMNAALSNGNVNVVQFAGSSVNDGFQLFDAGENVEVMDALRAHLVGR